MNFRARLSLFALESRENPSGPSPLDPIGGVAPPQSPTDPALTAPPSGSTVDDATAVVTAGATTPTTATATTDPLTVNNGIYNTPLVP